MGFRGIKYSPQTGLFFRCFKGHGNVKPYQKVMTSPDKDGYYRMQYDRKTYKLHRVAYFIMTGKWPDKGKQIDHINGIRNDNRWINIRAVSPRINEQNKKRSNLIGACKKRGIFECYAKDPNKGKRKYLGRFKTEIEAHTAYMNYLDDHGIEYLPDIDHREIN